MAGIKKYKPSADFKKFLKTGEAPTRVLAEVERFIASTPVESDRRSDVLHPSAMVKDSWCHRASYYQLSGISINKPATNFARELVFAEGHRIHAQWQELFQKMGKLWGKWHCLECDDYFWGLSDCHDGTLKYCEVSLDYKPLRIAGHSDGLLIGFKDPLMLEIKSVGIGTYRFEAPEMIKEYGQNFSDLWEATANPFNSHVTQVQIYMKLAELLELEYQPQQAVLIYQSKADQKVKEFIVDKSDFNIQHIFEAAEEIVRAVELKQVPPCNVGGIKGCKECVGYNESN
jgi:hypothetical protein